MHPELLANSIFLRYYNQWRQDPTSIVFAPIAEFLLQYGLVDDAIRICLQGLQHHPDFVSGRFSLAKAFLKKKEYQRAKEELKRILHLVPKHEKALELFHQTEEAIPFVPEPQAPWQTTTMAKIYMAQGHRERAREVYQSILAKDPDNEEARQGLSKLESEG